MTQKIMPPPQIAAAAAQTQNPTTQIAYFFCAPGSIGYTDHNNRDHGYIALGYLDIDIKSISPATQELQSTASASSLASTTLPL